VGALEPTFYPDASTPAEQTILQNGANSQKPQPGQLLAPTAGVVSPPLEPTVPVRRKARRLPRSSAALLIGLAGLLIAAGGLAGVIIRAGWLGSLSLLTHFGVIGARSGPTTPVPARGGTWTDAFFEDVDSLIPNGGMETLSGTVAQALPLPLFYGDAQGVIH